MSTSHPSATEHLEDADLPPRYCRGGWRRQLMGLGVVAALVLGFSLNLHFKKGPMAAFGVPGALANPGPAAAAPVAAALPMVGGSEASANVRQVGTALRTEFNVAAQSIRPSTLAVRASFGSGLTNKPLERIGSAVVVDQRGYAVTCTHVIAGASGIAVRRFREPEQWLPTKAVASQGDLTLLQISDTAPFVAATFANSDQISVGDWVLAAGHPFRLGLTVTAGIISRRNTTLTLAGGKRYDGLIQIDAAINEGSSGGPLVNLRGDVIGLNTAIYAPTGVFSGAGFAIPANRVRAFVSSILMAQSAPPAAKPSWGLGLVELDPALAQQLGFPGVDGVVVESVAPSSAADAARLARGDVITVIAGRPVRDLATVRQVREQLSGDAVSLEVWRRGVRQTLLLRLNAG